MKIITVPQETAQYPDLVASSSMDVRMKLGLSRIQLNYRKIGHLALPAYSHHDRSLIRMTIDHGFA